jgi:ribonucleoside-diphosphate reductase beta chain
MDFVIKRNGTKEPFDQSKIINAITKTAISVNAEPNFWDFNEITNQVTTKLQNTTTGSTVSVDDIDDLVENALMDAHLNDVAKAYISYRLQKQPDIFKKRVNLKPYEYPNLAEYVDAIRHSYWVHTEFNFTSDIQDFKVLLDDKERTAVQRAMLAISQIEIAVKTFWGDIYKKMPKPEIGAVGATFAESEVRHADAYSNLLKVLGLNDEFESLMEVPAIRKRIK